MAARKNSNNKSGYMKSTLGGVLCSVVLSSPAAAIAAEDDIVLIQGFTIEEESLVGEKWLFGESGQFGPEDREALQMAACYSPKLSAAHDKIEESFRKRSSEIRSKSQAEQEDLSLEWEAWDRARKQLQKKCRGKDDPPVADFTIIYAPCAMYMQQDGHQMLITLPPSPRGAHMEMRVQGEKKPVHANLNVAPVMDVMKPTEATKDVASVEPAPGKNQGNHLGVSTRLYETRFEGEAGKMFSFIPGMPTAMMTSTGTAWLAPEAPGLDVVRAFYRNFAAEVKTPGIVDGMLSGLVDQMSRITDKGMPMLLDQTVTSTTTWPMKIGRSGRSVQVITGIGVVPGSSAPSAIADICSTSIIADGEEAEDLNALLSAAQSGNPGASGADQSKMQQAMQEAKKAMGGIGAGTRSMMEKMRKKLSGNSSTD